MQLEGISVKGQAGAGASVVDIRRAELEGGSVTLMPLWQLEVVVKDLEDTAKRLRAESSTLNEQAAAPLGDAGKMLVDRWSDWPSQPFHDYIRRIIWLQTQVNELYGQITQLRHKDYKGVGGLLERRRDSGQATDLERQLVPMMGEVTELCVQLARVAPTTQLQDIEQVRAQGIPLLQKSQDYARQADQNSEAHAGLLEELSRRRETMGQLGFDALYFAAKAETDGLDPVDSPLLTRRGERAYFVTPARLARMARRTRYVGSSSGFSFPIGRTGIRYRVGSFSGRPIQTESLQTVDSGSLVVSNQRFAFLGTQKSIAIPLSKIIQVQAYRDGVAVSREGRESVDVYQGVTRVGEMLFYINWFIHQGAS